MFTCESSIAIEAETALVWRVLSDVASWPRWLPTVTRVKPLDGASIATGSRFVVEQPKLRPTTWKVSRVDAPQYFAWEAESPGLRMLAEHTITAQTPGSSVVILRFSFAGLFGGIVGRLFRSVTERYLVQETAALKAAVEK